MRPQHALLCLALVAAMNVAATPPLDRIRQRLGPYVAADDPLGLPLKVRSLSQSPYKFWRGTKDLYFDWIKHHHADWLADQDAYVTGHGDLHFGNIGTYAASAGGRLGFGMVDLDDSARVPVQAELLQGVVTLRLVAEEHRLPWTPDIARELTAVLIDRYREALTTNRTAGELLAADPWVIKLMKRQKRPYAQEVDQFCIDGRFRTVLFKKGKPTDLLRSLDESEHAAIGRALAEAAANDAGLAAILGTTDVDEMVRRVRAAAVRTRVDSSGSQGLMKLLVLVAGPNAGIAGDVLIYLKQQIPSAVERSGAVPAHVRSPGQRCAEDVARLTSPRPAVNSWCGYDGRQFWVGLKEPWSDELDAADIATPDALRHAAAVWGTVAGAAHRGDGVADRLLPRLTDALTDGLVADADRYVADQAEAYRQFKADPRVAAIVAAAESALQEATE